MNRFSLKCLLVGLLAAMVTLVGCSEEPVPMECGEGTEVRDGECVLQDRDCDDGEVVGPAGSCTEPEVFCDEEGVHYDVEHGECVSDVVCGEGTVEQDGVCMVEETLQCGDGTVLVDGTCQLTDEVCGPGAEFTQQQCELAEDACDGETEFDLAEGECIFVAELSCGSDTIERDGQCHPYRTYADQLADNADIDYTDNEPIEPTTEAPFVFTGTMDNDLEHTFQLDGQEGQWLKITIFSRGLPSPGFQLTGPFDFHRQVSPGLQSPPSRVVGLTSEGTFDLSVTTTIDDVGLADEDWKYVGEVEVLEMPEPQSWDFQDEPWVAQMDQTLDNMVEVDVSESDDLLMIGEMFDEDIQSPRVKRWTQNGEFVTRYMLGVGERIDFDVGDDDTIYLQFDAVEFIGDRTEYQVSGQGSKTIPIGEFYYDELTAEEGDTLVISHRSDQADPVNVRVFKDGQEFLGLFQGVPAENQSSFSTDESDALYFYVPEDGEYLIEFQNGYGNPSDMQELTGFLSTSYVDQFPMVEIEDGEPVEYDEDNPLVFGGEDVANGEWKIFHVDAPGPAFLEGRVHYEGSSFRSPEVTLYDLNFREVAHSGSTNFNFATFQAGIYMMAIQPSSSLGIDDIEVEFTGSSVDYLDPGETWEFPFNAETYDILSGSISRGEGPYPDLRLKNPHDTPLLEKEQVDDFEMLEIIPGPGEYVIELENTGDTPILDLQVDKDVSSPFDVVDVDTDYSGTYEFDGLEEDEKEVMLFRPETDYRFDLSVMYEEEEEGVLRMWDVADREVLFEIDAEQRIDVDEVGIDRGVYVFEFQALNDIGEFEIDFNGSDIQFVDAIRVHNPDLEISPDGEFESSAMAVDDCPYILDVSLRMEFSDTPYSRDLHIYLYPPGFNQPIAVREDSFGGHSTTYPDDDDPDESFSSMIGSVGTGIWSIDVENNHSSNRAMLDEWSLHLTCMN